MNDLLLPSRTIGLNENQLYILYRVLIRCLKTSGSFGFICLGRGGPVTTNPPKQNDWLKKNSILSWNKSDMQNLTDLIENGVR